MQGPNNGGTGTLEDDDEVQHSSSGTSSDGGGDDSMNVSDNEDGHQGGITGQINEQEVIEGHEETK